MAKKLYDIKEISEYMGVSIPFIRKLIRANLIPYYRVGNRLKFDINEINNWINTKKIEDKKSFILI